MEHDLDLGATVSTEEKYDEARRGIWSNPPLLYVTQSVAQTLTTSTLTKITFTNVVADTRSAYTTATSTYTVAVAGWYWFSAIVHYASNATGVRVTHAVQNGVGSPVLSHGAAANSSQILSTVNSAPVLCAVGDTLIIEGFQSSGGNLSTQVSTGYQSSWSLEWLRIP